MAVAAVMTYLLPLLLLAGGLAMAGVQPPGPGVWARAGADMRRLSPSDFPDLPPVVRDELNRLGCTIPQVHGDLQPHNVVRGAFRSARRTDVAVLCSREGASSILIFWGHDLKTTAEIARHEDEGYVQVVGSGETGYSREIVTATPDFIRRQHERYGGPKPPPLSHDGINDLFVGKASVVWYLHDGKWLRLAGVD
jgi:hypothetical protein